MDSTMDVKEGKKNERSFIFFSLFLGVIEKGYDDIDTDSLEV
jgi:hypothetical protein